MLILTRKTNQSIRIGDEIEIIILSNRGNQTKVGVIAPTKVAVHRTEVYKRILEEEQPRRYQQEQAAE